MATCRRLPTGRRGIDPRLSDGNRRDGPPAIRPVDDGVGAPHWSGRARWTCSRSAPPRRWRPGCAPPRRWPTGPARRRPTRLRSTGRSPRWPGWSPPARPSPWSPTTRYATVSPPTVAGWPDRGDRSAARRGAHPRRPARSGAFRRRPAPAADRAGRRGGPVHPAAAADGQHRQRLPGPLTDPPPAGAPALPSTRGRLTEPVVITTMSPKWRFPRGWTPLCQHSCATRRRRASGVRRQASGVRRQAQHGPAERGQGVQHRVAVPATDQQPRVAQHGGVLAGRSG